MELLFLFVPDLFLQCKYSHPILKTGFWLHLLASGKIVHHLAVIVHFKAMPCLAPLCHPKEEQEKIVAKVTEAL